MKRRAFTPWKRIAALAAFALLTPLSAFPTQPTQAAQVIAEVNVVMKNYSFNPVGVSTTEGKTFNIPAGTTVTWPNQDGESHNIAILEGPEINVSPEIKTGQKWSMTFTKPGRYHYYCEFHPPMVADIIVGGVNSTASAEVASVSFKETGRAVRGKFLNYWQKNGGLPQQGFPISEEMQEKSDTDGKFYTVQYYERAVFELHPEKAAPYDVLLSLLGNFEYKRKYPNGAPDQQANNSAGSVLFKETGKRVGGKFLDYWNKNGGLAQQGFPISNEFVEKNDLDGKTYRVQYFERAVFELHPENKPPYDVLLSQLGKFRFDRVVKSKSTPPNAAGIHVTGISSGPQHYPLLSGPHAAPGLNVYIYEQDPQPVVTWMNDLGAKWALHQLSWYQIEFEKGKFNWAKIDRAIDALNAAGVHVILHAVHSPPWAWGGANKVTYPTNPADFGNFLKLAAQRYKGKIAGFQIWNEPNLAIEAGKYVVAARYAELLKAGYTAVKSVDPNLVVISAPLTPTGVNDPTIGVDDLIFLKRLYAYNGGELKGYYDVLGAHPGSNANPPDTLAPDKPGPGPGWNTHPSFYFRRIEQLRQVMVDNGEAEKQMWLTEFGWASTTKAAAGFEYAEQNSEAEQADYIGKAFRMGRDQYPWMGPMILFQLNFALPNVTEKAEDERVAWGIIRRDGTKRPSYFAVQQYAKEWNAQK
ncbi:MAG TPA: cupredoxin domain-containing protein [Chloroflexia bacterium]|nr:cupredoxin domain-containing protein [Chloroflexia bacterium]